MSEELEGLLGNEGGGVDWVEKAKKRPYLVSVGLLGVFLLGVGVLSAVLIANKSVSSGVEVMLVDEETRGSGEVFVDVGGAVEKPGVYSLKSDSRINDVLVLAGGFSDKADNNWVSKNLNLAQKVVDGQKLYIPFEGESSKDAPLQSKGTSLTDKININSASISNLDTLWGVGEATAKKIVEGRPYGSIDELLTRKIVKANVYEEIKDEISVY
jgi:competence protein ComEA